MQVWSEAEETVLTITSLQAADAGEVRCVMTTATGDTASCACDLSLMNLGTGKPAMVLMGPKDATVLQGGRVELHANYEGEPEPSVRWLRAVSPFFILLETKSETNHSRIAIHSIQIIFSLLIQLTLMEPYKKKKKCFFLFLH